MLQKIPKPIKIAILALLILLVAITIGYFTLWRVSDSDYQAASSQLGKLSSSYTTLSSSLEATQHPGKITTAVVVKMKTALSDYQAALTAVASSPVAKRDSAVAPLYSKNSDTLHAYGTYITSLTQSFDVYLAILEECGNLSGKVPELKTVTAFDEAAQKCTSIIATVKSSPNTDFNSRFLTTYSERAQNLLTAYRSNIPSKQSSQTTVDEAVTQIIETGSILITYQSANPGPAINELAKTTDSRKSLLIR